MATLKTLKQFRDSGAIVSRAPMKRNIKWKAIDPESGDEVDFDADIYIVKLGAGAMADVFSSKDKHQIAELISKALLLEGEKGKPEPVSYEDAYQLDTPLMNAVWNEIKLIAGIERKNSLPPTKSSVNSSPAASEAEQ